MHANNPKALRDDKWSKTKTYNQYNKTANYLNDSNLNKW